MRIKRYYTSPYNQEGEKRFRRRLHRFVSFWGEILYSIVMYPYFLIRYMFRRRQANESNKFEVCICAIFKNEGRYLREWLIYHLIIGVDHFYLYNNNSDDNYKEVLAPFISADLVTLVDWPVDHAQERAYADCWKRFGAETHWLGYIDIDEFVNIRKYHDIHNLLRRYNAFPSLYLPWRMFGTSGEMDEPESYFVIERYTSCWKDYCNTGKSFINCRFKNFYFPSPHYFGARCWNSRFSIPLFGVSENYTFTYGNEIFFDCLFRIFKPRSCINHYWSKSYEWYRYKEFQRGDATGNIMENERRQLGRFEFHELNNSGKDFSIQRFLIFVKIAFADDDIQRLASNFKTP